MFSVIATGKWLYYNVVCHLESYFELIYYFDIIIIIDLSF